MVEDSTKDHRKSLALNRSRAKEVRHEPVSAEKLFWSFVRNRRLGGLKFKRQVLVGPYIADFVCLEHRLVIELDGPLHEDRKNYDAARDAFLHREGFTVLRFTNDDLGASPSSVAATILHTIENLPLPRRGRGRGEGAAKSKSKSESDDGC